MIFNLVWLPARQTGSSTRTKVLLRIMLRDTTVCEDDLVKQALKAAYHSFRRAYTKSPKFHDADFPENKGWSDPVRLGAWRVCGGRSGLPSGGVPRQDTHSDRRPEPQLDQGRLSRAAGAS